MKRLFAVLLVGMAVAFATAGSAQAGDRGCRSHSSYRSHGYSHGYSHSHHYSRSHSSGYYRPQSYYRQSCPPTYYQRSYNCQPRYYSPPCGSSRSFSISVPGFGFYFSR